MSEARYVVGDVFGRMAEIPDGSVDVVITSPPFLALRSYLPADHPDKAKEIGSEATPAEFLSTLLRLTAEWRRVLAPHGSLAVELGDTYSGSGGAGGDYLNAGLREGQPTFDGSAARGRAIERAVTYDGGASDRWDFAKPGTKSRAASGPGWPLAKSLCGIPDAYALSLEYGWNMLNPSEKCERWRVRNKIVWHRPNPPVGALGDKVRPSTSYVTVACVSKDRWFDLDAERTAPLSGAAGEVVGHNGSGFRGITEGGERHTVTVSHPAGAPPLDAWFDTSDPDVWTIPTAPYAGSHYATFPPALPRRLINLMCPRQVCVVCGEPRRRIVSEPEYVQSRNGSAPAVMDFRDGQRVADGVNNWSVQGAGDSSATRVTTTLGWSDCGHNTWRRGLVLDPFAGSGTTLQAASELGRDSIGIDLDPRNLDLARQRCGMFLIEESVA